MEALKPPPYAPTAPGAPAAAHSDEHLDSSSFYAYWHTLVKRKFVIGLSLLACLGLAAFINWTQTPIYQAAAELVIEPKVTGEPGSDVQMANLMRDPTYLMTQTRLVSNNIFAERVVRAVTDPQMQQALLASYGIQVSGERKENFSLTDKERQRLARRVMQSITLTQVATGARILALGVTNTSASLSAELANLAADTYIQINHETNIETFKKRFSMTSQSLNGIRDKQKASELALEKVSAEADLLKALKIYGEKYPEVIKLQSAIKKNSENLQDAQKNSQLSQIVQRQRLLSIISEPHLDLSALAPIEADLNNLKTLFEQEIETNREIYNSIYKKLQELELSGGNSGVWLDIKLIEQAGVPGSPIRPNKKMNILLALIVGSFIGIAFAFFLEYLDSTLRSQDDVKAYLKVTSLGIIPEVEFEAEELKFMQERATGEGVSRVMWSTSDSKIPLYVAEAYRIVRTNFVLGAVDKSARVFQVTSAVKGEGKTTTAVNLGISLAQTGMKVLLVDGDMRRPSLHVGLRLPKDGPGLRHVLNEGMPLESVMQKTGIENLHVITAGGIPDNPAELLASSAVTAFLKIARELFDVILIDSPPVISVADAPIIASHVDGTVLVARSGYIPRRLTLQAKKSIEAVNGKVIGCILNSVAASHHPYYYYRYYTDHSYGYYGSDSRTDGKKKLRSPIQNERVMFSEKLKLMLQSVLSKSSLVIRKPPPTRGRSGSDKR